MVAGMSGKEKLPMEDMQEILSSSRRKWQELIENLAAEPPRSEISSPTPIDRAANWRKDLDIHFLQDRFQPPRCKPGLDKLASDVPLAPMDTETIFQREERLHRIAQVLDRLTKVEKQNHKVMVLIFAVTISAFVFLLMKPDLFPKPGLLQLSQSICAGPSTESFVKTGPKPDTPVAGAVAGKYVGDKTSNEYHRPDCAAVKTGAPEASISCKSMAEAKRQGFKPCPVCQPPEAD